MSKFKIIGLDKLRDHGKSTQNDLIVNVIDKFIEDTVLHLLSVTEVGDFSITNHLYEDGVLTTYEDETIVLVEDADIFLSIDFEAYGFYENDGELDYIKLNFTKIRLNWMENGFNLIGTLVEKVLTEKILEWV